MNPTVEHRVHVLQQVEAGVLEPMAACELLQVRPRTLRHLRRQFRERGVRGLVHGNQGRRPANAYPVEFHERIVALKRDARYEHMNHMYFTEMLASEEGILASAATVRRDLLAADLPSRRQKRRKKFFRRRQRRPREGMLLQMDCSIHAWLDTAREFVLCTAVDDATNKLWITVRNREDAQGYFETFRQVAEECGLPEAIYVDRHQIFGGRKPTRQKEEIELSQFERAMHELGVRVIKAQSSQAKGRVERANDILQDRLVSWFKFDGVINREHVRLSIPKYLTQHRKRFTRPPADPEPAWRPLSDKQSLDDALCFKHNRVVRNDNSIRYRNQSIDLPPGPRRSGRARQVVQVLEAFDGTIRVMHQGKMLALVLPEPRFKPTPPWRRPSKQLVTSQ